MQGTRARQWFIRLALAIIAVQVLQFFIVDYPHSPRNQALYRYTTSDVIEIALAEDPNPMSRYSYLVALAEIAPGSIVYQPVTGDRADTHRLYGFGLVDDVVVIPNSSNEYPAESDLTPYVVASGPGAHRGAPWMIALDPAGQPGGNPEDPDAFLPEALMDGNRGSNPGPPREFVLLRWQVTPQGDHATDNYDYYRVLIETSLLTDEELAYYGLPAATGGGS